MNSSPGGSRGRADILTLCYHAVSPDWPAELSVTPRSLSEQVEYLVERGYRAITFSEAALEEISGKAVAITFDDAYASTVELARPILDRFGVRATVFVPTDYIGGGPMSWPGIDQWVGTEHEAELMPMSWGDARELAEAGWEIGSHTCSHPHLSQVPEQRLDRELRESRQVCERELGRPCRSIAYPYGDFDARVVAATERAGYEAAATFPSRTPKPSPLECPRIGVFNHDSMRVFRAKVSPTVRRVRRLRAWDALVRVPRKRSGRARG
jgi:peptidoglycan/xylan/chitin deacetylase (PgdA/CDA1 family)